MTQQERSIAPETTYKIFGLHIGCEVSGTYMDEPHIGYLTGLRQEEGGFDAEIQWIEGYHAAEEADLQPVADVSLLAKPLSSITDEDERRIIEICNDDYSEDLHKYLRKHGLIRFLDVHVPHPERQLEIFDFLRSRSYALPAFGYTTEELIAAGIFKIKEA